MVIALTVICMFVAACFFGAGRDNIDRRTVAGFSLPDYMGRWYEIARFENRFERGMRHVTADYTLLDDGTVEVVNRGERDDGWHVARGRAKATRQAGCLRVSFFWIFYSDYNVLAMGDGGGWALVGSRSPRYLWILSRTPELPPETVRRITETAAGRGYDTSKLIFIEQK